MSFSSFVRMHWAAFRALLVLTVVTGVAYPVFIWLVAQIPGLQDKADGSILTANGKPTGSRLIGQLFTDSNGNPLPQYFQSRPSAAGNGYDPLSSGASNLGPESVVDAPGKPSLLTQVCRRSLAVGQLEGVDGARPFCTGGGVGAVLSVIGPRDARGNVVHPTRVVSVNEPCQATPAPFLSLYEGVRVECAKDGEDYTLGQIVPIRGAAPADPAVPADAVTASASGLDPNISPAYADLQVARVAKARHVSVDQIREVLARNRSSRTLGFFGEPCVNVLQLNLQLDHTYPVSS
ncbi:potassium-transporting ATPase subunit C [Mycobacterium paraseoulense]|uniref:Potassium-transporting ATPase KdpC subunit n=1 Tax=Mycobacterium paraseoulense TaxID=590652 RepID=A0A1X0IGV9_9MYCO|nr:potassium-transporting ATPase subunit C [Mycobacterium paraseoulense]MCV7395231.1 potassium-transporting ATPase subunit C [Mycobacterium paraseoulense]ORB46273.1 K+-transporting ATPase subunit C [Mycobacterium paraseoulense]BBZ71619.1 potassium-transporting ATPase KdpC subunit [Mycobacterium paraseoulense]